MSKGDKISIIIFLLVMFMLGFWSGWKSKEIVESFRNKVVITDPTNSVERTEKTFRSTNGEVAATYSYPKRSKLVEETTDTVIRQCLYIVSANLAFPDEEATMYNLRFSDLLGRYSLMMMEELGGQRGSQKEEVPKWSPPIKKRNPDVMIPDVLEKGKNKKVEI